MFLQRPTLREDMIQLYKYITNKDKVNF